MSTPQKKTQKTAPQKKPAKRQKPQSAGPENVDAVHSEETLDNVVPKAPSLKIKVTEHHIATAIPENSNHCMIADAVSDAFHARFKRKPYAVSVDLQMIRFTDKEKGERYLYLTPAVAQIALLEFDAGQQPKAFNFRLNGEYGSHVRPVGKPWGNKSKKQEKKGDADSRRRAVSRKAASKGGKSAQKQLRDIAKRARMIPEEGHPQSTPRIVGGPAPPLAQLGNKRSGPLRKPKDGATVSIGQRRQFGLRRMGRPPAQEPVAT